MKPKLITFDCAETLVDLGWHPFHCMQDCADLAGVPLPEGASEAYGHLFLEWRPRYEEANLTRDPVALDAFWTALMGEWLARHAMIESVEPLMTAATQLAYGPDGEWFKLFDDVVPCLDRLAADGIRLAVISNWDLSLTRILSRLDLAHRFELIVASLEEGVEKPDPGLFHLTLERLGVRPEETVHVGDNPVDDVEGARAAGIRPILLSRDAPAEGAIRTLAELPEALTWSA